MIRRREPSTLVQRRCAPRSEPTGLTERMELDGGEVPVLDSSAAAGRLPAAAARCAGPQ